VTATSTVTATPTTPSITPIPTGTATVTGTATATGASTPPSTPSISGPDLIPEVTVTRPTDTTVNLNMDVKNAGGSPATTDPITVTYPVPAGITLDPPVKNPNWDVSITNGTVIATYKGPMPIQPGQTTPPLNLTGAVTSQKPISNEIIVTTPQNPHPTATDFVIVPATHGSPSLVPEVTVDNAPNGNVLLHADVRNVGDAPAMTGPITLTTHLPDGLILRPTTNPNWQVSVNGNLLTATYTGPLPINAGQATPALDLIGTLTKSTPVVETLTVDAPESRGPVSVTFPIWPTNTNPDLETFARADIPNLTPGQPTVIHVAVEDRPNAGIVMTGPVTVTFQVPSGEEVLSEDGNTNWSFSNGGNRAFFEGVAAPLTAQRTPASLLPGTIIVATYRGALPILPGQLLPEFRLTVDPIESSGSLVDTFTAAVPNDLPGNHSATIFLSVRSSGKGQHDHDRDHGRNDHDGNHHDDDHGSNHHDYDHDGNHHDRDHGGKRHGRRC